MPGASAHHPWTFSPTGKYFVHEASATRLAMYPHRIRSGTKGSTPRARKKRHRVVIAAVAARMAYGMVKYQDSRGGDNRCQFSFPRGGTIGVRPVFPRGEI